MGEISKRDVKKLLIPVLSALLAAVVALSVKAAPADDEHVYATKSGKVWHSERNCVDIADEDAWYMTFAEYKKEKKNSTQCSNCKNGINFAKTLGGKTYVYNDGFTKNKEIEVVVDTTNVEDMGTVDEGITQDADTSDASSSGSSKTSKTTTSNSSNSRTTTASSSGSARASRNTASASSDDSSGSAAVTSSGSTGRKSTASSSGGAASSGKDLMTEKQRRNKFRSKTNPGRGKKVNTPARAASAGFSYADFSTYNDYNSNNGRGGDFIYLLGTIMTMEPVKQTDDEYSVAVMVNDCDGYQWYMRCPCSTANYNLMKAELTGKQAYIYGTFAGYSGVADRPMMDIITVLEVGGKSLDMRRFR